MFFNISITNLQFPSIFFNLFSLFYWYKIFFYISFSIFQSLSHIFPEKRTFSPIRVLTGFLRYRYLCCAFGHGTPRFGPGCLPLNFPLVWSLLPPKIWSLLPPKIWPMTKWPNDQWQMTNDPMTKWHACPGSHMFKHV